ncbi:MAG: NAD(P)-dependent oxidoreductase [Desulfobacteraceae bacterium]|nr:MAG: NAD(P)-dependent oxidoreductase [Desulfobacteraceae bacterium]
MKVLVVGSTAVIGRAVAERLVALGEEVKLAGRREADIPFDLTTWCDQPTPDETFEVVVHVVADFGGSKDEDYIRAELVNAVGTLSACSLAHRVQAKHFVLLSSISSTYQAGDPYYGIYALTKRHSEEAAQFFCEERDILLTILRPSQVYDDSGACRRHQALFYLIADRAQAGQDIELFGAHDARRNYLHITELAEIIVRVIQGRHAGLFTCGHPRYVRLTEMANAAYAAFGSRGQVHFITGKPDLVDLPEIHDHALYDRIGFWPRIDIWEGYRRIKKFRENKS